MAERQKRHYLFTDDMYEEETGGIVRLDFTEKTVNKAIHHWCENLDYIEIAHKCKITHVECLLLLLDLQMIGKLPKRARDFYGRKIK